MGRAHHERLGVTAQLCAEDHASHPWSISRSLSEGATAVGRGCFHGDLLPPGPSPTPGVIELQRVWAEETEPGPSRSEDRCPVWPGQKLWLVSGTVPLTGF